MVFLLNTIVVSVEQWRDARKFLHSAMSITTNKNYQKFMTDESTFTIMEIVKNGGADFKIAEKAFLRYVYGVLTRSMLGFHVSSADDAFIVDTESMIDQCLQTFRPDAFPSNVFPVLRYLPAWALSSLAEMQRLERLSANRIAKVKAELTTSVRDGVAKDSIYRHFIENRKDYAITDEAVGYTLDALIGGGTRSPHNTLLTHLYLMMEYPEWQDKLQKHVDDAVGGDRLPSFDDIPQLPMVRAVVKETIRHRSLTAEIGIPHRLDEDDFYKGYFFPKGTVFHANY